MSKKINSFFEDLGEELQRNTKVKSEWYEAILRVVICCFLPLVYAVSPIILLLLTILDTRYHIEQNGFF